MTLLNRLEHALTPHRALRRNDRLIVPLTSPWCPGHLLPLAVWVQRDKLVFRAAITVAALGPDAPQMIPLANADLPVGAWEFSPPHRAVVFRWVCGEAHHWSDRALATLCRMAVDAIYRSLPSLCSDPPPQPAQQRTARPATATSRWSPSQESLPPSERVDELEWNTVIASLGFAASRNADLSDPQGSHG